MKTFHTLIVITCLCGAMARGAERPNIVLIDTDDVGFADVGQAIWNEAVEPGPNEIGFDFHFLIPATGDRVPCVYLEQHRVVDLVRSNERSGRAERRRRPTA